MRNLKVIFVLACVMSLCGCAGKKNEAADMKNPTLTYIGHASVKIVSKSGKVVYIDPNQDGDYSDEADYLFITHDHGDHQPNRNVVLKKSCVRIEHGAAHPRPAIYESWDFGDIQLEAVPASNKNHDINQCVGYIVTVDGIKIYHAGDTSYLDSMRNLAEKKIDYAMYPIDGKYNMDAVEATRVAETVGARMNIPIHEFDPEGKKKDKFLPEGKLVLKYGETVELKKQF